MASHDSISIASNLTLRVVYIIQDSNPIMEFDLSLWKPKHQSFINAQSLYDSVPLEFVVETQYAFAVVDENSFSFLVNGKRKRITNSKFFSPLKLSVYGNLVCCKNFEVFEVIKAMGHSDLVYQVSQGYLFKPPKTGQPEEVCDINASDAGVPHIFISNVYSLVDTSATSPRKYNGHPSGTIGPSRRCSAGFGGTQAESTSSGGYSS